MNVHPPWKRCGLRDSAIALVLFGMLGPSSEMRVGQARESIKQKETSSMQTTQTVVDALSRIADGTLLSARPDEIVDAGYDALERVRFEGIVVRTPAMVAKQQHSGVPILVCIAQAASRDVQVPAGDNAIVISNRVGGPGLWIVPVFPLRPDKMPLPSADIVPPPVSGPAAVALSSTAVQHIDLRAADGLPWEAGRYAVRVVSYDWRSNTAPIRLVNGDTPAAPQHDDAREALRLKWVQAGRGTADTLPHFLKSAHSPAFEEIGIAATFPQPRVPATGALPMYGVVRLRSNSGKTDGPTTVEAGYVILARRGILNPIVRTFGVPLYANGAGTAEVYFAYDLNRLAKAPLPSADYAAYFVLGEHTAGPYRVTVQ